MSTVLAERLLLDGPEVRRALGVDARLVPAQRSEAVQSLGDVVARAAREAAYRSFAGTLEGGESTWPFAVGQMALVFDAPATAERMFELVARAGHLRTNVGRCHVAVETAASTTGVVSYWGYLQLDGWLVVVTLDTIDPQAISMSHFRTLVAAAAARVESLGGDSVHS